MWYLHQSDDKAIHYIVQSSVKSTPKIGFEFYRQLLVRASLPVEAQRDPVVTQVVLSSRKAKSFNKQKNEMKKN